MIYNAWFNGQATTTELLEAYFRVCKVRFAGLEIFTEKIHSPNMTPRTCYFATNG